jgi:hypothetical protein
MCPHTATTGEVKLEALSSFLKDAVHGGDTVIAMRLQVLKASYTIRLRPHAQ